MAYGVQRLAGDAWGSWRHPGSLGGVWAARVPLSMEPVLASVLQDASCQSRAGAAKKQRAAALRSTERA